MKLEIEGKVELRRNHARARLQGVDCGKEREQARELTEFQAEKRKTIQ